MTCSFHSLFISFHCSFHSLFISFHCSFHSLFISFTVHFIHFALDRARWKARTLPRRAESDRSLSLIHI